MHIYKKAFPILFIIGTLLLLLNIIFFIVDVYFPFRLTVIFFCLFFYAFIIAFFRISQRDFKPNESIIYSPADGKIVAIETVFEDEFLKNDCKKISVFMSVFNVHQNLIPISGKVIYSKYHPGKYLVAWHPKSSLKNERQTVVIETPKGEWILIRQIAGFVARRIICNVNEGDEVKQGDELGFIMFGSRVDVFMPSNSHLTIKLNDIVKGNISKIGKFEINV